MAGEPYQAYRDTQVTTAAPGELLLLLYGGAIRFGTQAVQQLTEQKCEEAHKLLLKTQDLVAEMTAALDFNHELAHHLYLLYDYMTERLVEANLKKDPRPAAEAVALLRSLREAWETALKKGDASAQASGAGRGISRAI